MLERARAVRYIWGSHNLYFLSAGRRLGKCRWRRQSFVALAPSEHKDEEPQHANGTKGGSQIDHEAGVLLHGQRNREFDGLSTVGNELKFKCRGGWVEGQTDVGNFVQVLACPEAV